MIQKLILKCKNDVINNKKITRLEASKLFNIDDKFMSSVIGIIVFKSITMRV